MTGLRLFLVSMLMLALAVTLSGATADELAKEVAKRDAEVAKAKQAYDAAVKVADDKALKNYVRLAQRAVKDNDTTSATTAWTEVLRLDRKQAEAVAWFTKLGTLDTVVAELDNPTDLLGNPLGGAAKSGKAVLVFGPGGALVPAGVRTLMDTFSARTTELVVGSVIGDGVLFEEGAAGNGQAIGVIGSEIHYVVRAGNMAYSITAPFDRRAKWTQIAVQFDAGVVRLWLDGKPAAKGDSGFATIPGHGGGGIGFGDGSNPGGWTENCQFLLASLRIANKARYSDQVKPVGVMDTDADTVLAVTPEAIALQLAAQASGTKKPVEPIMLQKVDRMPPGNITWTASGMVGVR
jgi:Concanavalin A-like lectin/glucanases superfamily